MGSCAWSPGTPGSPRAWQRREEEEEVSDSEGKWFLGMRGAVVFEPICLEPKTVMGDPVGGQGHRL